MHTASILIKTDPQLKIKAQKIASKMGLSLTSIINRYLKYFITTETITFSARDEKPTQYLINAHKESETDVKAGRVITFKSKQDELNYLAKEIEDEKRRIVSH